MGPLSIAVLAICLHVLNYNATAQIEFKTRCFTKMLGRNAVYYYACYLVLSAIVRDHFINQAMSNDAASFVLFGDDIARFLGWLLFIVGVGLNLWTLHALGIKGMYNGDSFGWLMSAPVTNGPFQFMSDPQYIGTTMAFLGYAVSFQSLHGYFLTACIGLVFWISVKFIEGPHMAKIYSNRTRNKLY